MSSAGFAMMGVLSLLCALAALGVVTLFAVVGLIVFILLRRKKRDADAPPDDWTDNGSTGWDQGRDRRDPPAKGN